MATIEEIRKALGSAWSESPQRAADWFRLDTLQAAIDELERFRAEAEKLRAEAAAMRAELQWLLENGWAHKRFDHVKAALSTNAGSDLLERLRKAEQSSGALSTAEARIAELEALWRKWLSLHGPYTSLNDERAAMPALEDEVRRALSPTEEPKK